MSKKDEALELAQDLRTLADRFSEGWHDGIKIDASDIMLLTDAAATLAEQPAHPVVPDAIHHTDLSESLEYIQGWNDCRAAMFEGKENT